MHTTLHFTSEKRVIPISQQNRDEQLFRKKTTVETTSYVIIK